MRVYKLRVSEVETEFICKLARWQYMEENPGRKRSPVDRLCGTPRSCAELQGAPCTWVRGRWDCSHCAVPDSELLCVMRKLLQHDENLD